MNQLASITASHAPALIVASGPRASYRFLEFFAANIRNPHTRRAYARAAVQFFDWLATQGATQLAAIREPSPPRLYRGIAPRVAIGDDD
jgi:hypothetical protein